ncbi:MAG: hypothetical protein AAGH79_17575 [Bacteroidota bacterium]
MINRIPVKFSVIIGGFFLLFSLFSRSAYQGSFDPPYQYYGRMGRLAQSWFEKQPPHRSPALIIAPKGIAEYWTFRFGWDVMPWLPEYSIDADQLYRLARGPWGNDLAYYLPETAVYRIGTQTFLLLEKDWQTFLRSLQEAGDDDVLLQIERWQNPASIRPEYLLRRQRNR